MHLHVSSSKALWLSSRKLRPLHPAYFDFKLVCTQRRTGTPCVTRDAGVDRASPFSRSFDRPSKTIMTLNTINLLISTTRWAFAVSGMPKLFPLYSHLIRWEIDSYR